MSNSKVVTTFEATNEREINNENDDVMMRWW
jgi:hypothetical protein